MGKTKEMLIAMQEEMAMNFPTPSSNTLSEPVQTIDIEAFTDDLYNLMVKRIHNGSLKDILEGVVTDLLDKHGIQTGSQTSLASQLRKSLDEK